MYFNGGVHTLRRALLAVWVKTLLVLLLAQQSNAQRMWERPFTVSERRQM